MATQNSEHRDIEKSVKIGEENADLIRRLEPWCSHLKVELVNHGMLAEMYGLPIGRMSIQCPHAEKGISAMQLREVAAYFIRENCKDCPHQEELNPNNAGRDLLRAINEVEEERKKPVPQTEAKRRLREAISGDLAQALEKAPDTEQSVLKLIALLEDKDKAGQAGDLLVQAADIAPELFAPVAWDVLSEYLPDVVLGTVCAKTLRVLANKTGALRDAAIKSAWRCVDEGYCGDEVLALLGDHIAQGGDLPIVPVIGHILGHQGYAIWTPGGYRREHPGLLHLLGEIGKRDASRVADACCRRLEDSDRHVRAGTSIVLRKLLPVLPELGALTRKALLESLALDDDRYEISADGEACRTLSIAYADEPAASETDLLAAFAQANEEVKGIILNIYGRFAHLCREDKDPAHAKAVAAIPVTLDRLLAFISTVGLPLECRITAAESVKHLASKHASLVLPKCDAIFGMLALIFGEKVAFLAANPGGDPLLPGFPRSERLHYDRVTSALSQTLTELGEHTAQPVFDAMVGIVGSLNSKDEAQMELKACLVGMYETLFEDYHVGLRMVPYLFNALMDMESVTVRAVALTCLRKVLASKPELVPDNMKEMLKLYLGDPLVALHQRAARCMSAYTPASEQEAGWIAYVLCHHFKIYKEQDPNDDYLGDLLDAVIHICHGNARLFRNFALPVILSLSGGINADLAESALSDLRRETARLPVLAPVYVADVLSYFKKFEPGNGEFYSPQKSLLLSLYDQPLEAIADNQAKFEETILRLTKDREGFTAFQILAILFHFELYETVLAIALEIEKAIPHGDAHQWMINEAKLFAAAAKAEMDVSTGNTNDALATLEHVSKILTDHGSASERNDPSASFEAFNVAHAAAARIR